MSNLSCESMVMKVLKKSVCEFNALDKTNIKCKHLNIEEIIM